MTFRSAGRRPAPVAGRARLLDDLSGAHAPEAHPGLDELPEDGAADGADLAAAATLGADLDGGGVGGAGAFAVGAYGLSGEGDLLLHAEGRFLEGQLHLDGQVVAAGGPSLLASETAAERLAERAAEEVAEQVAEVGEGLEVEAAGAAGAAAQAVMAVGVVEFALLLVAEHLVGLGGLLELLLAIGRVAGHVGMVLAGQLAVGLLDLLEVGVPGDAEHFVVVAFHQPRVTFLVAGGAKDSRIIRTAPPRGSDSDCAVSRTVAMAFS